MQVALLRKKVRKYHCPFQGVYPEASFAQKSWNGHKEGGGEGESSTEKKSHPPHRIVEKFAFHPFHETSTSFRLPTNQFVSPPTSARSIVIIVPRSHPFATPQIAMLWKFHHQAACRKVA